MIIIMIFVYIFFIYFQYFYFLIIYFKFKLLVYIIFILFYYIIFFQLPNYLICPNCFSLLAHLGFYITFVSNFHLLLVCMYYL